MKFLADVNIEKSIIDSLLDREYDIKWIPDYNCEMLDEDLLNLANGEARILITNDKDFGELVFLQKKLSTGIILLRIKGQSVQIKVDRVQSLLDRYPDKIVNHFVVITNDKIRFVPLESIK